jgi:hypothetical protein
LGAERCGECGAALAPLRREPARGAGLAPTVNGQTAVIGSCPRCGFRGEGLPYFSRGSRVAALVGMAMFTAGAMGIGGILYYVLRKDYEVCPRCHASWGRYGERALARVESSPLEPRSPDTVYARGSGFSRGLSWVFFAVAAVLAIAGVAGSALPPLLMAGAAAAAGLVVRRVADRDRERRRAALLSSLQPPVLQLAARRGAQLTVTETAAELGWSLRRAEKVLQSLDDGVRVSSEVTDEGVIVYEFRELARSLDHPA